MTRISEVHGLHQIPADEFDGRGAMVSSNAFLPYLSMTKGEMMLALAAQRANILAEWYGSDAPQYRRAAQMYENALNMGVSNGPKFMGSIPDELQPVAAVIARAARQTQPASKALFFRPNGIGKGIGQTVLPYQERYDACRDKVDQQFPLRPNTTTTNKAYNNVIMPKRISAFAACKRAFDIERILNGGIENSSHHVVYKDMPPGVVLPTEVVVKRTFHRTGVEGMALVGDIDTQLMYGWVENGIIGKNAQVGAGPLSSVKTSAYLAPDPQSAFEAIQKKRPSAEKWDSVNGIGAEPVTTALVLKIIGAITTALKAAEALLKALRSQKAYAMSEARGFGTDAFSASQNDWLLSQNNPPGTTSGGISTEMLLLGAAALFLLTDDK